MSFNETVPLQIFDLEKRIKDNGYKIGELNRELVAESHVCDCEFCDYQDEFDFSRDDSEIERNIADLKQENDVIEDTIRRLKQYAKDHNIQQKGDKE